jgi:hypothetical protein
MKSVSRRAPTQKKKCRRKKANHEKWAMDFELIELCLVKEVIRRFGRLITGPKKLLQSNNFDLISQLSLKTAELL